MLEYAGMQEAHLQRQTISLTQRHTSEELRHNDFLRRLWDCAAVAFGNVTHARPAYSRGSS